MAAQSKTIMQESHKLTSPYGNHSDIKNLFETRRATELTKKDSSIKNEQQSIAKSLNQEIRN